MMSQLRTLHASNAHSDPPEQQSYDKTLTPDAPIGSSEQDRVKAHSAQSWQALLPLYVGCPSRLKLLGLHIGNLTAASSQPTIQAYLITEHDDDTSR